MIVVDSLSKSFKLSRGQRREMGRGFTDTKVVALDGVSFTCRPGRIFCLVGPNGAGKTTALRTIATLLRPSKGTVTVSGFDTVKQAQAVRQRLGFSTGATALYDRLTPDELVLYFARLHGVNPQIARQRRDRLFSYLEVDRYRNRRIAKLSTGMKQKVSITRTLLHDPEVVVFDEATAGLDVIASRRIHLLIQQLKEEGKTILFSTHRMDEVDILADDIALMHRGRLCFHGTYADFKANMLEATLEEEFIRIVETPAGKDSLRAEK